MSASDPYTLSIGDDFRGPLARFWLLFGVAALLISGLFVLLILFSRTPGLQALFPSAGFFQLAIVVHVDFSVLIWFSAMAAVFWTLAGSGGSRTAARVAPALAVLGAVLVAISPFLPGAAIMSNYVPVLDNSLFLTGIAIFTLGAAVAALRNLLHPGSASGEGSVLRLGITSAAVCLLLALVCLVWAWLTLPDFLTGQAYYETLFWGSGHVLQFAWTQLMLVAWLWIAAAAGLRLPIGTRLVSALLLAGAAPALLGPLAYVIWEVGSPQQRSFFIWQMAAGGGLAAGPLGMALLVAWWRRQPTHNTAQRALRVCLIFSLLLFGIGGFLGFFARGSNTIVPAHYHGCIVAITLVFMGLSLHLLPALGFARANAKLSLWMPWVYGSGQLLHIAGLAWSGGHGVQRKTAVATQGLEGMAQIAGMAVMGIGGLIAVIGGVLFLIAVGGALRRRPPNCLSQPA